MSTALAVHHGPFGRATVYRLDRPLAPHAHREGHLIFLLGGRKSRLVVGDHPRMSTRTKGVAVSPWQTHSFAPGDPVNGSLFLVLYINQTWFLQAGGDNSNLRFGESEIAVDHRVEPLVEAVSTLLLDGGSSDRSDGFIYELTRECYDQSWTTRAPACNGSVDAPRVSDFRIRNALQIMRNSVGDQIVLDRVARESGLSRPHFYKLFRQNVGLTPNIYLNTLKMELSIEALTKTLQPVTSIGLDLGFSSQASFSRFFTANVGIPPTIYRQVSMTTT